MEDSVWTDIYNNEKGTWSRKLNKELKEEIGMASMLPAEDRDGGENS